MTKLKHVKLFENFEQVGNEGKFIYIGFSEKEDGYAAGVVSKEEAEALQSKLGGMIAPLADNVYAYIDLEQTEMRPEKSDFDITDLSFVSADCKDNYYDDNEPDYNKLVIELPMDGIISTSPDSNGWNARLMSFEDFIS
jgi:hypothetical protein